MKGVLQRMLPVFIALAVMGALDLGAGVLWLFFFRGRRQHSGAEEGGESLAGQGERGYIPLGQLLRGREARASYEVSLSFAEIKELIRARRPEAFPVLLMLGGLAELLIFGALALWVVIADKIIGSLILVMVVYGLVRAAMGLARA